MIRIRGRAATYGDVWYHEVPDFDDGKVDILRYRHQRSPIPKARHTSFLSLVSDLSPGDDEILNAISKECRYEIRRAEQKDGLEMDCIVNPESRLREFHEFYETFARQKSLESCDLDWLIAANDAGQLLLTTARQGNEILVWHAYVLCGDVACLQHSASCFRDKSANHRALTGRANRWLHWRDMLRLKRLGYLDYDWGGMFEDESAPERAGINKFKRGFGGREERSYDCIVPVSLRGRMYLPLRDAWHGSRSLLLGRLDAFRRGITQRAPARAGTNEEASRPDGKTSGFETPGVEGTTANTPGNS